MATWASVALLLVYGFICLLVGIVWGYKVRDEEVDDGGELMKEDDERLIHAMAMGYGIGHDHALEEAGLKKAAGPAGEDQHGDGV